MRLIYAGIALCALLLTPSADAYGHERIEPEDSQHIETTAFVTTKPAGFSPKIVENSNASVYSMNYTRTGSDGVVSGHDTALPMVHFYQTVLALPKPSETPEDGAQSPSEQLLGSLVRDAKTLLVRAGLMGEIKDDDLNLCTRVIAGVERTGTSFPTVLAKGTQENSDATTGVIECYTWRTSDDKIVGVTLKRTTDAGEQSTKDEQLASQLLETLQILPIDQHTPYVYTLAGYPLSLPVGSQLSNLNQATEHAITAQIAMYGVTGNMKLMLIPDGYSVFDTASELKSNHEKELEKQRDQGKISILWDSVSMFPVGPEAGGKAQFNVSLVKFLDGSTIYNQHHVLVDDRHIIEYSFNCAPTEVENLHGYAQALYDKARPDFGFDVHERRIYSAPGYELRMPAGYQHQSNYSDGRLESMVIHGAEIVLPKLFPVSALRRKPSTQIRFYPSDAGVTLEDAHREICQQIREHSRERTLYPVEEPYDQALTELQLTLPGGSSANAVSSMFLAKNNANSGYRTGTEYENTRITSILVPAKDGYTMAVVSSVANVLMHPDALAASLQIAQWTKPIEHPSKVELEFANLEFDPWTIEMVQYPTHSDGSDTKRFTFGTDTVTIAHETIPEESLGLSDLELTELFIQPAYNWISHADEAKHYPKDPEVLTKATLAGHNALYFEHQLYAPLLYDGRTRTKSVYFRIYGVRHGDRYMVVTMRQDDNFYAHRFEKYHTMFTPKD